MSYLCYYYKLNKSSRGSYYQEARLSLLIPPVTTAGRYTYVHVVHR
jgi:hypothetical protein